MCDFLVDLFFAAVAAAALGWCIIYLVEVMCGKSDE